MTDSNQQANFDSEEELIKGYEAMAADVERENEAVEWIEALIGECL